MYTLRLRPTDYYHFVFPNLALDEPIKIADQQTTPREVLGLYPQKLKLDSLDDYPCHFPIGTGTVFITSDRKVVISIRSRRQFVVESGFHLSAAEGMLRPVDEKYGEVSPFWTSVRSLEQELGLNPNMDFSVDSIRCLGIMLDTLRAQLVCVFYVQSSTVTSTEAQRKWQARSVDKHENNNVLSMNWDEETARILLGGQLDVDGSVVPIASNHAQAGFLLAALHDFGDKVLE